MAKLIITIFLIYSSISVKANTDSLLLWLNKLEESLHFEDTTYCNLYKFINFDKPRNPKNKIDSFRLIRCNQPDHLEVTKYLRKIMHSKDGSIYPKLRQIYTEHISLFYEELFDIVVDPQNYYLCDFLSNQVGILSSFENALISLEIQYTGENPMVLFEQYINEWKLIQNKKYLSQDDFLLLPGYKFISPKYAELGRRYPVYRLGTNIFYLDPYHEELIPLVQDLIDQCNPCEGYSYNENESCYLISRTRLVDILLKVDKSDAEDYFLRYFDCWKIDDKGVFPFIIRYATKQNSTKLGRRIAEYLVNTQFNNGKNYVFNYHYELFLENEMFLGILIDEMAKSAETDLTQVANRLKYIPHSLKPEAKKYIKTQVPKDAALYRALNRNDPFHTSKD